MTRPVGGDRVFQKDQLVKGKLQAVTPDRWIRPMRFQHCNRGWMVQFTLFFLTEPDASASGPQYQWLEWVPLTFFNMFYGRHVEIWNSLLISCVCVLLIKCTKGRGIHKYLTFLCDAVQFWRVVPNRLRIMWEQYVYRPSWFITFALNQRNHMFFLYIRGFPKQSKLLSWCLVT